MKPGPAVAQQLGPMGINMGKVISDVNEATKNFKGMKVPVELDVDEKTKDFEVKTFSPPTSELLKKEAGLEKGTNDHKNIKVGNLSIEDVIKVTNVKYSDMLEKEFKSAVKSVLGTCASVGLLVENKSSNDLIADVSSGKFDKEIDGKISETSDEKREKLNEYFDEVKTEQDTKLAEKKKEEEEAEAAKAEEAAKGGEGADVSGGEGAEGVGGVGGADEKKEEEKK